MQQLVFNGIAQSLPACVDDVGRDPHGGPGAFTIGGNDDDPYHGGGGGVAFSADDRFAWRKVLPTYGLGLRWSLHEGSNLRIDAGFGRKSYALILGINESF